MTGHSPMSLFNPVPEAPRRVRIFDSTLSQGELVPGISFSTEAKVEIAMNLDALGVDVIEAGFPAASEGERKAVSDIVRAVKRISRAGFSAEICALARAKKLDIELALEGEVDCVHIFMPTSKLHLEKRLRLSKEEAIEQLTDSISLAKSNGAMVEFSAEDASRSEPDFLWEICKKAEEAGADRINLTDTVGILTPEGAARMTREAKSHLTKPVSTAFYNDLGMSVANSIAAVMAGADQVHVSVNGLGPKAGMAPLEQVAVALKELLHVESNIQLSLLPEVSELVERHSGLPIYEMAPIVGPLTYTYEAGVHVHAISIDPATYELIPPEKVGRKRRFLVGKLSGRTAVIESLKDMGYPVEESKVEEILAEVKKLADKGVRITDGVFRSIVEEVLGVSKRKWFEVKEWMVVTGSGITSTAQVKARMDDKETRAASFGVGPVDALANTIRSLEGVPDFKLRKFRLRAISLGTDAVGEVLIRVLGPKGEVEASGTSPDILEASLKALEDSINKIKS